nr:MAG TPA: Protein of unknown function (DUF1664) [Caudoviricetes sp.]
MLWSEEFLSKASFMALLWGWRRQGCIRHLVGLWKVRQKRNKGGRMNEAEFLGYLVLAIITLGGFVAVIVKFVQPINDLRIVIQKLNDCIEALRNDNDAQNRRIEKHGEQIDDLNNRVGKMETKMEHIHKSG